MSQTLKNTLLADDNSLNYCADSPHIPELWCPTCRTKLTQSGANGGWLCPDCAFRISEQGGIFRSLSPERERHFRQFIQEYSTVRSSEGRGSSSPAFYLALPYKDVTGENPWQWHIRARTFDHLTWRVLQAVERSYPRGCDVLDIGAGNCWLSYRMSLRGHRPVAVDLLENDSDGLGAAKHYFPHLKVPFPRFLAEMDILPFASAQFDMVIFNASFHYSVDYCQTLREALRCLRRPGILIVADSPFYSRDQSGRMMVEEKHAAFERRFGFRSDSIPSLEFLTTPLLKQLEKSLSVRWQIITPWYGLAWAMRPWKARLLGRREPSRFRLIWTEVLQ